MAAYAELQPAADGSRPLLRIELPQSILRAAANRPNDGWLTLLVQAVRHLRPPGTPAFLAGIDGDPRRLTVSFVLPAQQEGEPPLVIVRWLGDTASAVA